MSRKKEEELLDPEEQFVLRILDLQLAEKVKKALQEGATSKVEIVFQDSEDEGKFIFEGQPHPLKVLSLPTIVESYKTYDDTNLVKTTDIGQILIVGSSNDNDNQGQRQDFDFKQHIDTNANTDELQQRDTTNSSLIVFPKSKDGITPPFRNARSRVFRKPLQVEFPAVERVEVDLLTILSGGAPVRDERYPGSKNTKFIDTEEIWQVDEATGQGAWVPVMRR